MAYTQAYARWQKCGGDENFASQGNPGVPVWQYDVWLNAPAFRRPRAPRRGWCEPGGSNTGSRSSCRSRVYELICVALCRIDTACVREGGRTRGFMNPRHCHCSSESSELCRSAWTRWFQRRRTRIRVNNCCSPVRGREKQLDGAAALGRFLTQVGRSDGRQRQDVCPPR